MQPLCKEHNHSIKLPLLECQSMCFAMACPSAICRAWHRSTSCWARPSGMRFGVRLRSRLMLVRSVGPLQGRMSVSQKARVLPRQCTSARLPPRHRSGSGNKSNFTMCSDRHFPTGTVVEGIHHAKRWASERDGARWRPSRANRTIGRFQARRRRSFVNWQSSMRQAPL